MIYSLEGILTETDRDMAVISCGGVGYGFRASLHTLSCLPKIGEKAFVYVHTAVREDAIDPESGRTLHCDRRCQDLNQMCRHR